MTLFENAVFQGQGIRSFAFIGALITLEENNIKFQSVSGVSGGSIVAALYAAGYTAKEMEEIFYDINIIEKFNLRNDYEKLIEQVKRKDIREIYRKIKSIINPDNEMALVRIFLEKGFARSDAIGNWISMLLQKKGIVTFSDLNEIDLTIIAADITPKKFLIFNKNTYPELAIADAVECSICIPGLFRFKKIVNNEITDGGILSRLPLFVFTNELDNTVAFEICEDSTYFKNFFAADLINSYVNIVMTAWKGHDNFLKDRKKFTNSLTIDVHEEIHSVKFELTDSEKRELVKLGSKGASEFLIKIGNEKYLDLQKSLQNQEWIKANTITGQILLSECNKGENEWFEEGDITRILTNSPDVFETLERMWMNSSEKKFGFRNQKEQWIESGKPKVGTDISLFDLYDWGRFLSRVGWKARGFTITFIKTPEQIENEIKHRNFNLKTIEKGYLPNLYLLWFKIGPRARLENLLSSIRTLLDEGQPFFVELFEGLDNGNSRVG